MLIPSNTAPRSTKNASSAGPTKVLPPPRLVADAAGAVMTSPAASVTPMTPRMLRIVVVLQVVA
jgi:hypothetical protein